MLRLLYKKEFGNYCLSKCTSDRKTVPGFQTETDDLFGNKRTKN